MELTGMMRRNSALFTGRFTEYITPKWLYKELDDEFHFTLDPCTTPDNPLGAPKFYTKEDDGLKQSWKGQIVYCNPPYNSKNITQWIEKAWAEACVCVMLLPSRTDTRWFHRYINPLITIPGRVRFLRGRLKFEGVAKNTAPFPSLIVVFK